MSSNMNKNLIALSIDVEDWFTVRNMREFFDFSSWKDAPSRLFIGLDFILEELAKRNIKATFFVLGWIAEVSPETLQKIHRAGHEIGTHGHSHTPLDLMDPASFEQDLVKSIEAIERACGTKIKGFRAPSFSITKETIWAIEILKKHGLSYDSSIFSITHPDYGIRNFPTRMTSLGGIIEVSMRKGGRLFGLDVPVCGGGYFRLLPYVIIKRALQNALLDGPVVMYFHPWEFDPDQPVMKLGFLKKFRHYVGLRSNRKKFQRLLDDFNFVTMWDYIESERTKGAITLHSPVLEGVPAPL